MIFQTICGKVKSVFSDELGIDLGTMNTLVCQADKGVIIDEPSVVACYTETGKIRAVGMEAKMMLGKTSGVLKVYRPVKNGVIADSTVTDKMLGYFIKRARGYFKIMQPRVLVAVPYGITTVE
ncbi:MAG: rod shape-determining protein, partial [Victivallales bacterium]|nr:rod shape-determining protein [Victivallales bacterium]